jgi:hypothetical protein
MLRWKVQWSGKSTKLEKVDAAGRASKLIVGSSSG